MPVSSGHQVNGCQENSMYVLAVDYSIWEEYRIAGNFCGVPNFVVFVGQFESRNLMPMKILHVHCSLRCSDTYIHVSCADRADDTFQGLVPPCAIMAIMNEVQRAKKCQSGKYGFYLLLTVSKTQVVAFALLHSFPCGHDSLNTLLQLVYSHDEVHDL